MKRITWALLAALAVLQYQIWINGGGLRSQYTESQNKAAGIARRNAELRRENAMLRAQVDDLKNGYEALAELARSELGYIEDGETYYSLKSE